MDKNDKPVGIDVSGMKKNVRHNAVGRQMENRLSNLESDKFKEFVIYEYILEIKNKFGTF